MPLPPGPSVLEMAPRARSTHLEAEAIFRDLNLDRLESGLVRGREAYDLAEFFREPVPDVQLLRYRQAVCRDLEASPVRGIVDAFAASLTEMHAKLARAERLHYPYQKLIWYLAGAEVYCSAVENLAQGMGVAPIASTGFRNLATYLRDYVGADDFRAFAAEVRGLRRELEEISYTLDVHGSRITVRLYDGELDYSTEVEATFERFRQAGSKSYDFRIHEPVEMNHIEEAIFEQLVQLRPEPFARLRTLGSRSTSAFDPAVLRFEREVQFYLAYLDLVRPLRSAGLEFSYPAVDERCRQVEARDAFDLVLALELQRTGGAVVRNDLELRDGERVWVVTGPNQGGKTTYARMLGQLAYLARLGWPVPGRQVRLPLCDRVFTLFERVEHPEDLRGKLEDELVRARSILDGATAESLLVFNESFSSTSLRDATGLGRHVLSEILARGSIAVYVTFVDELSRIDPAVVSVVSTVFPDDPTRRTFRVVRARADGRAFAAALAQKYGLTYDQIRRSVGA